MSILVFGKTGQVARELQKLIPHERFLGRGEADFNDTSECIKQMRLSGAKAVINAAAYTDVDRAETERDVALTINAITPTALASEARALNIPFIHISSDYVFNGKSASAYEPTDATAPVNFYGHTKNAGEEGIRRSGCQFVILRTSSVFSGAGNNFLNSIIKLAKSRPNISVVSDQISGPTPARSIASACICIAKLSIINRYIEGIFHLSGYPDVSRAEFAGEIIRSAKLQTNVNPVASSSYPSPARRPASTKLNCNSLQQTFGIVRPDWRKELRLILSELETA